MTNRDRQTSTSDFGVGRREGHDSSKFYERFSPPAVTDDETINRPEELLEELGAGKLYVGAIDKLKVLPENSVALVVTSPPYFVGKEYELAVMGEADSGHRVPETYFEFLDILRDVFRECNRVLEPGGRIAVNVANLGRKPYRSLSADIISLLQDDLGMLLRGEVIWEKADATSGSCAWGSFAKASNPVLRDVSERVIIASKGRFSRAVALKKRRTSGLPHESSLANDEFVDVTKDIWKIQPESATRIGHPAPFPIELPRRLIDLYTYKGDIVVDPFVGSGTTIVAAARTGRIGVGFDTDADYVELAEQRLEAELDRIDELASVVTSIEEEPLATQGEMVKQLSLEDRQEHFQARAVNEGKKAQDIARRLLTDAGFETISEKVKHPKGVIDFSFRVTHPDGEQQWWVDVSGAFVTNRPGLQRTDAVWKLLGKLNVFKSLNSGASDEEENNDRVLVLTSNLPKRSSPGDQALRAVSPASIFDAIELYDPAGLERLRHYAATSNSSPLPGFWSADDIERAGFES